MKRNIVTISGCVQGVGFRPFIYRLAHQYALAGHIKNTNSGVVIDVQGDANAIEQFLRDLIERKPNPARISEIAVAEAAITESKTFQIKSSEGNADTDLALLPDTAMCLQCLAELFDPENPRCGYPFLHCIACGPRFSLFTGMPFDRHNTTMADFTMCKECLNEYADPGNRRFYSQTNCCPQCGPVLQLLDKNGKRLADKLQALEVVIEQLLLGKIVAMKNTGGYLLLADAGNEDCVSRLRVRKNRPGKPFAMLMPDLCQARQVAEVGIAEENALASAAAPIVLLKKSAGVQAIAPSVAPDNAYLGIMLPHNALQHLITRKLKKPLIATSGNISGRPLCITEEEALVQLATVADLFLVHNRRIMHRVDDSVVQIIEEKPTVLRRARGYIPYAIPFPAGRKLPAPAVFGAGGQLKNSFAFAKNDKIYLSQYIGTLESAETCRAYDQEVARWEKLLDVQPSAGVGDKHPDYYTAEYLNRRNIASTSIQHHQAHVWAGMIDNQLKPPFLSFAWDGTGLGEDHTVWGGEAFVVADPEKHGIRRSATMYPFRLPGGEKAIREPRRSALGVLHAMYGRTIPFPFEKWVSQSFLPEECRVLSQLMDKGMHAPVTSSMGRLFDAVSALLGCCLISQFEGHAAMALEAAACNALNILKGYSMPLIRSNGLLVMDWRPMLAKLAEDISIGIPVADMASAFHQALARCIADLAHETGLENVLLTGGVMQNKLLAENAIALLKKEGFKPYWHHHIPPNDGGLAVGQVVGKALSAGDARETALFTVN